MPDRDSRRRLTERQLFTGHGVDYESTDVETAAYLAREDARASYVDERRPTRAEAEEDARLDRLHDQRREESR